MSLAADSAPSPAQLQKLLRNFSEQLRAAPDDLQLQLKLAEVLRLLERHDEAIALYSNVAWSHAVAGHLAQAIMLCKLILELNPDHRSTQRMLARLYASKRIRDEKQSVPVRRVDGRWVAEPDSSAPDGDGADASASGAASTGPVQAPSEPPAARGAAELTGPVQAARSDQPAARSGARSTPSDAQTTLAVPRDELPTVPPIDRSLPPTFVGSAGDLADDSSDEIEMSDEYEDPTGNEQVRIARDTRRGPSVLTSARPTNNMDATPASFRSVRPRAGRPLGETLRPTSGRLPSALRAGGPAPGSSAPLGGQAVPRSERPTAPSSPAIRPISQRLPSETAQRISSELEGVPTADLLPSRASRPPGRPGSVPLADQTEIPTDPDTVLDSRDESVDPHASTAPFAGPPGSEAGSQRDAGPPLLPDDQDEDREETDVDPLGMSDTAEDEPPEGASAPADHAFRRPRPERQTAPMAGATVGAMLRIDEEIAERDQRETAGYAAIQRRVFVEGSAEDRKPPPEAEQQQTERDLSDTLKQISGQRSRPATEEIPVLPLFSDLDSEAFVALVERLEARVYEAGEEVLREGDPGDSLLLVSTGRLVVLKQSADGRQIPLAELRAGSFFGEFGLLTDQQRHATVRCEDSCEILELRRDVLADLIRDHPSVSTTLRRFYRQRVVEMVLATSSLFRAVNPAERDAVVERFVAKRFTAGQTIVEQGDATPGLFVILVGEVAVSCTSEDADDVRLATLREGDYFGEMSLISGDPAEATVRALRLTEVLELPSRDFYAIASTHPEIWAEVQRESELRATANQRLLAERRARALLL